MFERIFHYLAALYCRMFGHSIVDESYAGPDTGYDSFHCNRCGWDFDHTYY